MQSRDRPAEFKGGGWRTALRVVEGGKGVEVNQPSRCFEKYRGRERESPGEGFFDDRGGAGANYARI